VARFNVFSPCYVEFKTYPTSHGRLFVLCTEWPTFLYYAKVTGVEEATVNWNDAGNLYSSCTVVKLVE
jgi:hypothetical protein